MIKKETNKKGSMRERIKKGKVLPVLMITAITMMVSSQAVFAASVDDVLRPFDMIKQLFLGVIACIGVIVLAKNVMEAAQAYQGNDTASLNSALKGCAGGFVMAAIGTVLTLLGF